MDGQHSQSPSCYSFTTPTGEVHKGDLQAKEQDVAEAEQRKMQPGNPSAPAAKTTELTEKEPEIDATSLNTNTTNTNADANNTQGNKNSDNAEEPVGEQASAPNQDTWAREQIEGFLQNLADENLIDVFDMRALEPAVIARPFADNTSRAIICLFTMNIVPVLVGIHVAYQIVDPEEEGVIDWGNFCHAASGWDFWATKLTKKITAASVLFYMYHYIEQNFYRWDGRPTTTLFRSGYAPGIMKEPFWSGLGVVANAIALVLSGLVSIIVAYSGETPLDVVLNSIALFFIFEIDEMLVDKYDYQRNQALVESQLQGKSGTKYNAEGKVQLWEDKDAFFKGFSRFDPSDTLNYWSEEKDARRGQLATVVTTYEDLTLTLMFDDGTSLDFPEEALVRGVPPLIIPYAKFVGTLGFVYVLVELVKWIVLLSPVYVLVCM